MRSRAYARSSPAPTRRQRLAEGITTIKNLASPAGKITAPATVAAGAEWERQALAEGIARDGKLSCNRTYSPFSFCAQLFAVHHGRNIISSSNWAGRTLPLTDFGTASFTAASANGQSLATAHPVEITMPDTAVFALTGTGTSA